MPFVGRKEDIIPKYAARCQEPGLEDVPCCPTPFKFFWRLWKIWECPYCKKQYRLIPAPDYHYDILYWWEWHNEGSWRRATGYTVDQRLTRFGTWGGEM